MRSSGRADPLRLLTHAGILLALALHVAYFILNWRRGFPSLGVDGDLYRRYALDYLNSPSLLGENSRDVFWTPWYVVVALLRANPLAVFVFNLVCFASTVYALLGSALLLRLPYGLAAVAALAYATYWPTFDQCVFFHYEVYLAFFCASAVFLAARWWPVLERKVTPWIALGLLSGFSLFVHTRALGIVIIHMGNTVLFRATTRRWGARIALYLVLAALPCALWGWRNHVVIGRWVFSSSSIGYNLYVGYNPVATGYFRPQPPYPPLDRAMGMALGYIRENPGRSAALVAKKAVLHWLPSKAQDYGPRVFLVQEWIILPLAFAGFCMGLWRLIRCLPRLRQAAAEDPQAWWILTGTVGIAGWFNLFHAIFYVTNPRFRIPAMPALILLAVYAVAEVTKRARMARGSLSS